MSMATEFPENAEKPIREEDERSEPETSERAPRSLSLGPLGRLSEFFSAVKLEMRKTTWPNRTDVWSTTVVVLIAILFFGFYLWGVDRLVTLGFEALEKAIR